VAALLLLLAACGTDAEQATPTATLAPAPEPTATPAAEGDEGEAGPDEPAEPTEAPAEAGELPEDLNIASLEANLAALDDVYAAAVASIAAAGGLDAEARSLLGAIFGGTAEELWTGLWSEPTPELLAALAEPPGPPSTRITALLLAEPGCVAMAVDRDFSAMFQPGSDQTFGHPEWHVVLAPLPADGDPDGHNPTSWQLVYDGFESEGGPPRENPC
jgi:hypothetical protein